MQLKQIHKVLDAVVLSSIRMFCNILATF